jgi:hypothetical protein
VTMTPEFQRLIDETPTRRGGGVVLGMTNGQPAPSERRRRGNAERVREEVRACEKCGQHVPDSAYRAALTALGYKGDINAALEGPRKCAECFRKARETEAWLNAECARLDERDREAAMHRRPPLGLRIT